MGTWSIPLDVIARKAKGDIETIGRKITFELFYAVQLRSPVDTGRFRANWQFGAGKMADGIVDANDINGSIAAAQALKAVETPLGGIVYFTNNLPYAERLEYGYSDQAPQGMVRLTVRELESMVTKALAS